MPRAAATRKTSQSSQKSVKATGSGKAGAKQTAKKAATTKKVTTKKNPQKTAQPAFLPLKDTSYVFVDFKDKDMEAQITSFGGKVTRSLKTAHILVCEDIWGDKAMDALNKYDRIDDGQTKEDVLDSLAEFVELGSKPNPTVQVGKKSIIVNSDWFTEKGIPLLLQDDATGTMIFEDEDVESYPYDCCFHEDGNVVNQYSRLTRLQLLQDNTSGRYVVIGKDAYLESLVAGNNSAMIRIGQFDDLPEAVTSFQNRFRESVGYTWKNRASCKPKKGSALVVDLETFNNK